MYQKILIPVEIGDAEAYRNATDVAATLVDAGGSVTLFHAIEPIPTYVETYVPPDIQVKSREGVKQELEEMSTALGVDKTEFVFGSAGRSIVDWAQENDADCILVSSHKPGFSDIFLGSTAAWVVRHAQTNVFVLR